VRWSWIVVVAACGRSEPAPSPPAPAPPSLVAAQTGPIEPLGSAASSVHVRRGELALPRGSMKFALVGDGDRFDRDDEFVAFDLDRDGALDLTHLTSPELFHVFERSLTIDGEPWAIEIAPDGSRLALRHLDAALPPRPALAAGTPAPDARVTTTADARELHLRALAGQVVLLDFWSPTCKPCVAARPHLRELRARLHPRGFEIVSVDDDASGSDAEQAQDAIGVEARDLDAEAVYRIDRFPSYFVIDRRGAIACAHCTLDQLEPMLDGLLTAR
jgi:thiol-disulfide isomerase/thioredoxin